MITVSDTGAIEQLVDHAPWSYRAHRQWARCVMSHERYIWGAYQTMHYKDATLGIDIKEASIEPFRWMSDKIHGREYRPVVARVMEEASRAVQEATIARCGQNDG